MLQRLGSIAILPIKEHQPGIEVIGQHGQLEMILVGHKKAGRMRRQSGIVVRLLDQILRTGTLVVKPHEFVDRGIHVGHKHSIMRSSA